LLANYGYRDGSGNYYITIDTDLCNGCGDCTDACPKKILEVMPDDYDETNAQVRDSSRKLIKDLCAGCKPVTNRPELPCTKACAPGAIIHSW